MLSYVCRPCVRMHALERQQLLTWSVLRNLVVVSRSTDDGVRISAVDLLRVLAVYMMVSLLAVQQDAGATLACILEVWHPQLSDHINLITSNLALVYAHRPSFPSSTSLVCIRALGIQRWVVCEKLSRGSWEMCEMHRDSAALP